MRNKTITKTWGKHLHRHGKKHMTLAWSAPVPEGMVDVLTPHSYLRDIWWINDTSNKTGQRMLILEYQNDCGMYLYRIRHAAGGLHQMTPYMSADQITAWWVTSTLTGELEWATVPK